MAEDKYTSRHTGQEIDEAVDAVLNGGLTDVVNNLTTNDATKALSAKMGKVLKDNIEVLNGNINALIEALANTAFKSLPKPTMSELDFGGDKYAVTLNNTLSGCTSNKSGVQQVTEGSNLVITITADNGKLLRSVTASSGSVVISSSKESATITIANVMADATITINASATSKGSFTASISDSRVSGTGAASGIVEGSAWSSQLSLNNTAEEGAAITSISASMAGGGEISVDGNTISTSFVTGNITITAVVRVVGRFNVTLPSDSRLDFSNGATSVPEGSSYSNTLSLNNTAEEGAAITNISASMEGGGTISVNGNTISTANVTGNIVISASVRVAAVLVHSYLRTSGTDSNGRTCLVDQSGNGFNLYGNSNLSNIASGYYGNGRYDGINGGNLKIKKNGSWTIHVKNYQLSDNGTVAYTSQQIAIYTNDARSSNSGFNVSYYSAADFSAMVSTGWGTGNNNGFNTQLYPTINGHEFGKTATIKVGAANRKSFTFVFDSDASTISLYLEGVFIATESVSAPFCFAGISIKMAGSWDGVDFYNGALTAEDVASLITT